METVDWSLLYWLADAFQQRSQFQEAQQMMKGSDPCSIEDGGEWVGVTLTLAENCGSNVLSQDHGF